MRIRGRTGERDDAVRGRKHGFPNLRKKRRRTFLVPDPAFTQQHGHGAQGKAKARASDEMSIPEWKTPKRGPKALDMYAAGSSRGGVSLTGSSRRPLWCDV